MVHGLTEGLRGRVASHPTGRSTLLAESPSRNIGKSGGFRLVYLLFRVQQDWVVGLKVRPGITKKLLFELAGRPGVRSGRAVLSVTPLVM